MDFCHFPPKKLLTVALRTIRELVETLKAVGLQLLHAPCPVVVGVVVGDERHAHHDSLYRKVCGKVLQVLLQGSCRLAGVPLVNDGVHLFDVHDEGIHMGQHCLQVLQWHVEGGFEGELPVGAAKLAEADEVVGAQ